MNYEPIGISFFDAEGKLSKLVKYFVILFSIYKFTIFVCLLPMNSNGFRV